MKREIELDFVRGLAILLVLDFHSPLGILFYPFRLLGFPHFGWIGVDVFFVLSGFLVGGLLVKEWKLKGRIDSKRFLIRRGFKIWPQYYIFIVAMLLTGHRTFKELWGNLLNIQNYVGGVAHTWSLAVEEHAYLLLVACLAIAAYSKVRMRTLFILIAGTIGLVIVLRYVQMAHGWNVVFATHTRIDGILEGVLLAMLYHYRPDTFRRLQVQRWMWIAILIVAFTCLRFSDAKHVPYSLQIDCSNAIGIAAMMLLYRHHEGRKYNPLYRFVAWLGLYSYGIYLWHVSVVAPLVRLGTRLPHLVGLVWIAIAPTLLGALLGIMTTKVIEFPMLHLRDRLFPRPVDSAVGTPAEIEAERADDALARAGSS